MTGRPRSISSRRWRASSGSRRGDFRRRLDTAQMSGFFRQISDGINGLLEANSKALDDVAAMFPVWRKAT